ncbi:recombinase family protein [Halosaccharopolyspora lacisalsi]|uniref:recombinase family protein n=1 Tax=Halosaccharopolyspora lacisalsi TaxID=1000566 RepID=UPI0015F934AD|nr:recombinase family protein [Halosaccharopolyspora lacisalsi]
MNRPSIGRLVPDGNLQYVRKRRFARHREPGSVSAGRLCHATRVRATVTLARRPELDKALLAANRAGDQLVVTKLDRLGRSLEHLIELSKQLQTKQVDLVVLDQGIDTSTAVGRMFFQIIGAIAEFEHALMSERTIDGLAAARARGRTGGQKPKLGPRQVKLAREMYDETGDDGKRRYTVAQIAAEFGVTRPTIYRHLSAG